MARKILLADDSVTAQNMGRKILADAGYEVITVNNGSAALKKIAEQKPDLIVLDVYMPGYSGLEVCQRLKEVGETARIPVLLTVGKLEPFKPEEAKRVRAEGFIVKPFEASELLSALSKLEDKIVPRSESAKTGRFARAIAAVEESNRDKNAGVEDSGWKNRISFPSKKKGKEKEEAERGAEDDPRTVPQEAGKGAEGTVHVGAVAAELPKDGLPKDVTLEEIAAIAAAAAQVQSATAGAQESPKIEAEPQNISNPVVEHRAETSAVAEVPAAATYAEAKVENQREEKIEVQGTVAEKKEARNDVAMPPAEVVAAISASAPANGNSMSAGSGNGAYPRSEEPAPVPVTMAAAAAASCGTVGSRWMAVPVTTDAAEAAISLDQEMQKAYAAFVAAEASNAKPVAAEPVAVASTPAPAASSAAEPSVVEPRARASAHEESELGQALSTVANAPPEAPRVAGSEAPAAESHSVSSPAASAGEEFSSSAPVASAPAPEAPTPAIQEATQVREQHVAEPVTQKEEPAPVGNDATSSPVDGVSHTTPSEPEPVEAVSAAAEAPAQQESAAGGTRVMAEKRDSELAESTAAAWASWRQIRSDEPKSGESSEARRQDDEDDEAALPADRAAMAAAAGAEKRPEDGASASDPRGIASIVDSVLAELRPKIVEEISRKLGDKK